MFNSLLGRIGLSDLPSSFTYVIKDVVGKHSVFTLHSGYHKTTKEPVSIFICERKNDPKLMQYALRHFKKLKSIKHPSFLNVFETADVSSGIYIVTEEVVSLLEFCQDRTNSELLSSSLSWDLFVILDGIAFLHDSVKSVHGAICPETVFVTRLGEWKISGLDLVYSRDEIKDPASSLTSWSVGDHKKLALSHPTLERLWTDPQYNIYPIEALDESLPPTALDKIAFAALAAWSYSIVRDRSRASWRFEINHCALPESLHTLCRKFLNCNTWRCEDLDWTSIKTNAAYFKDSELVQCMTFFASIALKGNWDKEVFFEKTVSDLLQARRISESVQTNFILPRIVHELETAAIPHSLLPSLVRLFISGISLIKSPEAFQRDAIATLTRLMLSNERSSRYYLLQSLPQYERHLNSSNAAQLFDSIALGLTDQSAELRDVTLRAMLIFIPKLSNDRYLMTRGFRMMGRCLQSDDVPYIRTNAVICFAKLVESLSTQNIIDSIAPHFLVGLHDSFLPTRVAALQGLGLCLAHVQHKDLALKYLPALCPRLVDDDTQSRQLAFDIAELLMQTLRAKSFGHEGLSHKENGQKRLETAMDTDPLRSTEFGIEDPIAQRDHSRQRVPLSETSDDVFESELSQQSLHLEASCSNSLTPTGRNSMVVKQTSTYWEEPSHPVPTITDSAATCSEAPELLSEDVFWQAFNKESVSSLSERKKLVGLKIRRNK